MFLGAPTIRGVKRKASSIVFAAAALGAAMRAQTFSVPAVVFPATGDNRAQTQNVDITLPTAIAIQSISIPMGFTGAPDFTLVDPRVCKEDGTTVNPAGTVCHVAVRFRAMGAGQRNGSLIVTDAAGNASAIGISAVGYSPQIAITPSAARVVAGQGPGNASLSGDGGASLLASLNAPHGVAADSFGNVYFADTGNNVVRMLDAFGNVTTVAGGGTLAGAAADGHAATQALLNAPTWLAVDPAGNLFIAETGNHVVRRVSMSTSRTITTFAGSYSTGFSGDGAAATAAQLNSPQGLAIDSAGNLYLADGGNARIRRVDAVSGLISTVAGSGGANFDSGTVSAASAGFAGLAGLAFDVQGNLYISDGGHHAVRALASGNISLVAGTGTAGNTGDGGAASAATLNAPSGLAVSAAGDVFIVDAGAGVVRKIAAATGLIETVAGEAKNAGNYTAGVAQSTTVRMNAPSGIAFDASWNLFLADSGNNVVRELVTSPGELSFAAQAVGNTSSPLQFRVANIGNAPFTSVSVSAANAATSGNFVLSNSATEPCGSALQAGSRCVYSVSFAPAASGFVAGEVDVRHVSPGSDAVEPVYLTGGIMTDLVITPASLNPVVQGTPFSAVVSASGGFPPVTLDLAGSIPPGMSVSQGSVSLTLSGTPTQSGTYSLTAFATDSLGQQVAKAYSLQVLDKTVNLNVNEIVHVLDNVTTTPGVLLAVNESIHVSDNLSALPSLTLNLTETVHVTDSPQTSLGKINQTVTVPAFAAHSYGDAAFQPVATATSGLAVVVTVKSGPARILQGSVDLTGAGTVTLLFSQPGNDTYNAAPDVEGSFTVAPATLNVTATSATRDYGAPNPVFSYTLVGFVRGDSASAVTGAPTLSTTAVLNSPAGTYPISVMPGSLNAANYNFNPVGGTLTVAGHVGQTIIFLAPPANIPRSLGPVSMSARSTSGLPVSYSVNGPATVNGNVISFTGNGVVTVTAGQAGNQTFDPAPAVIRSFTVTP